MIIGFVDVVLAHCSHTPPAPPRSRKKEAEANANVKLSGTKRKGTPEPESGDDETGGENVDGDGKNGVKRWRKKELSVTIDESDNCYLGLGSSKSSALPEDTPRRVWRTALPRPLLRFAPVARSVRPEPLARLG
jgi:hypothetical protein